MTIKECIICGKEFDARNNAKTCSKKCSKENRKQCSKIYYQDNKEHILKRNKQYRQGNKEHIREYNKQYRQDNKEHIREYNKQYRQDNKERLKRYFKQYYQDNKEYYLEMKKQYYQDNKEHYQKYQKQYQKQYYQDNKERKKQYYQENKSHILEYRYQHCKEKVNELINQYDGDLEKILENIPSRWHLREAQMQVWFNESYYDGLIIKIKSTPCCEVTGKKDNLVIHHLYSFNTHPILGNDPMNMVRVDKDVHNEFHNQYGHGNNTPQQWEQFVEDYNKKQITLDDFR